MKLKIPPAFVLILFGGLMYLLARFLPFGYFNFFGRIYLVYLLFVMAVGIVCIALLYFYRAKTSINPLLPSKASKLVNTGLYQYSRNPMYLGLLLLLLAWGLWLGNAFNTVLAAAFVYYMNAFQIGPEEQALEQIFGKEYRYYCKQVRRWF